MKNKDTSYNGWKNYETWNVALWIGNDEGLYSMAREHRHSIRPYQSFVESLKDLGSEAVVGTDNSIYYQTPDGVAWNDSGLDIDALNEMIEEL